MISRDDYTVRLVDDLPASVGGFISESPDGHLNIYLNARHGWNGQRRSFHHELRHADADDLRSTDPLDVIEARADQKPSPSRAREACAIPCLKEGGSAPALSDEVAAQKPSPLGKAFGDGGARCPQRGRLLGTEEIEVVEAEIDRQRIQADLLKVAAGNLKSAEDYELLLVKARAEIDALNAEPGPMRRLGRWLLGLYGLAVVGVARAYRAQDLVLGGGRDA